jgi:dTDP-4-amino-4,6-dideoxygalactose transaminase
MRIEERITAKTRAIVVVHYAGIACDMMALNNLATKYSIPIIEDAAQAIGAKYNDTYLGSFGALSAFSFHETKNINCGEGGAIIVNDKNLFSSVEKIREKGTNRSLFLRGEVDKYTWVSLGSSFLPSDLLAAYLYGQFENYEVIQSKRLELWNTYNNIFLEFQSKHGYSVPFIPEYATGNAHIFYLIVRDVDFRTRIIDGLKGESILAVSHYVPLHSSPIGRQFSDNCSLSASFINCNRYADCLIRMPLYHELTTVDVEIICEKTLHVMEKIG